MMNDEQFANYCLFLNKIDTKLKRFFDSQRPYIFCKEGCSKCCQKGAFPCSEAEFEVLNLGFNQLDENTKSIILEKAEKVKKEKSEFKGDKFNYECPFLINDRCSVYMFRPIICRTFGLPYFDENDKMRVPFCVDNGLNYSQVYNSKTEQLSEEMYLTSGIEEEPVAFNLSLKFLLREYGEKGYGVDFGEQKTIIDWF